MIKLLNPECESYKNCGFLKKNMILRKKKVKNACRVIKKYYLCIVFEAQNCFNIKSKRKMQKLVLMLAVLFSVSLFSCGSSDKAAEAADSAVVVEEAVVEEVAVVDSAACDSACAASAAVVAD